MSYSENKITNMDPPNIIPRFDRHLVDGLIDFAAGSLGGIALVYVGQPLDTIKVKMQTYPLLYSNMTDCVKQTLRNDGVFKGLYAGTTPALVCNIAENSVLFLCYGVCQKLIQHTSGTEKLEHLSALQNAGAGSLASFFASIVICPTELIKCKLQAMNEKRPIGGERVGPLSLVRNVFAAGGITGMFKGFVPTVAREMPGYFFFFGGYEGTRNLLASEGQSKDDIGLGRTMLAGSVGGALFWTSTYPIDVAKSRIQVSSSPDSLFKVIGDISKTEGVGALYNGLRPTIIRTLPATAVLFATYEYSKKAMNYFFRDRD